MEQIEVKRKVYDVVEHLGDHSVKATRKGKAFFIKTFEEKKSLENFEKSWSKIKNSGIRTPKVYLYDKNTLTAVLDYIEGETIYEKLQKEDLTEEIYEQVFQMNYFMRTTKLAIDYNPGNFKFSDGKLYYLSIFCGTFTPKDSFEKEGIYYWFYTPEFVKRLIHEGVKLDQDRANVVAGVINKNIALTVVKYYR